MADGSKSDVPPLRYSEKDWAAGDVETLKIQHQPLQAREGVRVRYRISDGLNVRYLALGWRISGKFYHCKQLHVPHSGDYVMDLRPDDLAVRLDAGWETPPDAAQNLEFWCSFNGPSSGHMAITSVETIPAADIQLTSPDAEMRKVCHDFMARGGLAQYDVATKLAREMVSRPVLYVGPDDSVELDKFGDFRSGYEALSNSHRYMYHALGHVRIFLVAYQKTGEAEFLVRARRHVHDWIEDNFEETPEDIKYAYYDHGAAERLGVMCTIWSVMRSVNASAIDTAKIEHCLIAHARLLGSWSFTGRHQPVFIHNHLVFQAIYCLLAGILLNKHPESDSWRQHGSDILAAQVDGLISSDGVSIENSTGYHLGLYRVLRDCTALLLSTPIALPSSVAGVRKRIAAMGSFTERMRFSADRMPAIGDTRYTPNLPIEKSLQVTREQLELSTRLAMFPDAGYASIKDDVGGQREMNLTMIASALSQTHKHDDDLSITLSTNDGIQWIADPGFYKYDRSELSMYASSVMAHNAPYLADGQYEHKLRRAGLDGEEMTASDLVRVEGWHKHYPGVLVTRHLLWHSALSTLVIEDQVAAESRNETSVTVGFVLGDGITAERSESNSWTLWHRAFDISGPSIVFPDGSAICEDDATVFPMGRPTSASRLVITRPFVNGIARVQTIVTWSDLEPATLIDTVAHSRVRTKLD